jgi:hypothetical protein
MTTDYRAMCAELVDSVELLLEMRAVDAMPMAITEDRLTRARALLAQPEPEVPTDEEIMELMPQQMRDDLSHAARAIAGFDRANIKAAGAIRIILDRHAVNHARAAIAKWGTPTPQPVAVSERPWERDDWCDALGKVFRQGQQPRSR